MLRLPQLHTGPGEQRSRKRALRKPSGLLFSIADRLHMLNPQAWDQIVQGQSVFFDRGYLAMLETSRPANLEPRYALISDAQGPVAVMVMQILNVSAAQFRAAPAGSGKSGLRAGLKKMVAEGKQVFQENFKERLLVAGNLLSYGMHAVAMAPDVDPACVWPGVAEVLYRVRRAEKLSGTTNFVLIKDVVESRRNGIDLLEDLSYRRVETEPNMVLQLAASWNDYDAYLAAMASKYRSAVKNQILQPIEQAGIAVKRIDDVAVHADRIHALYLQVHGNASVRPFCLNPAYWAALAGWGAQEQVCFNGLFKNDKLLGFIVNLKDADTAVAYHIGFDRKTADDEGLPLYLRLLHASVAQGIAMGAREISFGRTALEPKARMGAKPQPVSVMIRHRQPVLNRMMHNLLSFVHHEQAPDRNPFKAPK